jgi:hypothetical protein
MMWRSKEQAHEANVASVIGGHVDVVLVTLVVYLVVVLDVERQFLEGSRLNRLTKEPRSGHGCSQGLC